jgi:hypothetical protein
MDCILKNLPEWILAVARFAISSWLIENLDVEV